MLPSDILKSCILVVCNVNRIVFSAWKVKFSLTDGQKKKRKGTAFQTISALHRVCIHVFRIDVLIECLSSAEIKEYLYIAVCFYTFAYVSLKLLELH